MQEIAGGFGRAVTLRKGEAVRLVNTFGSQVVDTWALAAGDLSEYMSVEHTRRMLFNLFPKQGDTLYSNRREPMLLLEEDTSPGKHDMLFACCDKWLYKHYGSPPGHRNCRDNFLEALFEAGHAALLVPNPLNLWMNIPVSDSEAIGMEPPLRRPRDTVLVRALRATIVMFSACPMGVT